MPLFTAAGYDAVTLDHRFASNLQNLFERCADYFEMAEGRPPGPDAATIELRDHPPNAKPEDAFCIGLLDNAELIAVLHAFRHYPLRDNWYLGLLLLDPVTRNTGIGEAFYHAFEIWAAGLNAEKIQLAVLDCNQRAAKFWERMGFLLPRCYPNMTIGLRQHIVIEYEKPVASQRQ